MSFVDHIFHVLRSSSPRDIVVEHGEKGVRTTSRAKMLELIASSRSALSKSGVMRGDRVAILGKNSSRWIAIDLAILSEGAIVVPLYARQSPEELVAIAKDAGVKLLCVQTRELGDAIWALWPEAPIVGFRELFDAPARSAAPTARRPDDVATIVYTSGTSGTSKGAMITYDALDFMLPQTSSALSELMSQAGGEDVVYHYLPMCFMGSRLVVWTCLFRDNAIHLGSEPERILAEVGMVQPHYFLNVPVLLERFKSGVDDAMAARGGPVAALYTRAVSGGGKRGSVPDRIVSALAERVLYPKIRARFGGNLRFLICGSAALRPDVSTWFERIGIPVYQVYGLTETTGIVTMDRPQGGKTGTVGFPLPRVELKLGEGDELLVRGPNLFTGYWNRPKESAAAFSAGWFRTGDQATIGPDGRLAILGRTKNILVLSSGHNVAPEPIEQRLAALIPGLVDAIVVGHARPHLVVLLTGEVDEPAIKAGIDQLNDELPHYQRVRAWQHRRTPLSDAEGLLTANGKPRRTAIEDHFKAEIDRMYP